jgi:hypothetical protein
MATSSSTTEPTYFFFRGVTRRSLLCISSITAQPFGSTQRGGVSVDVVVGFGEFLERAVGRSDLALVAVGLVA